MADGRVDQPRADQLRADARRNREQIVAAAREIFVARGVHVPMDEIAREAGVGVGTLYRRFPDRNALIMAVSSDILTGLAETARGANDEPDAWQGLRSLLHRCAELRLGVLYASLGESHAAVRADADVTRARTALIEALTVIVDRVRQQGGLRPDVGVSELFMLVGLLIRELPELPGEVGEVPPQRFVDIMLDGLRRHPGTS